jgi:cyanophycin synthetase
MPDHPAGFEARLRALFPALGPLRRQPDQASLAHVLELTLALQIQAGCPVTFSRTTETVERGTFQVVVSTAKKPSAARPVRRRRADPGRAGRWQLRRGRHHRRAARTGRGPAPGPSTGCIVHAAVARGIPFRRLTSGSLVQLGWGAKAAASGPPRSTPPAP